MTDRVINRGILLVCLLAFFLSSVAIAFETRLDSRSIREAYFLGQRNSDAQKFLSAYLQHLPLPAKGPHVAEIELLTPYAQEVKISQNRTAGGYSAQQAEQEYAGRRDTIEVRVLILFTNTYSLTVESMDNRKKKSTAFRSMDFWKDFQFRLVQENEAIDPSYIDAVPQYTTNFYGWDSVLSGSAIYLRYDARQMKSLPAKMDVLTPDGHQVTATFDLAKLR